MRLGAFLPAAVIAVGAMLVAPAVAQVSPASNPASQTAPAPSRFLDPVSVSSACTADPRRWAACGVVEGFFRAVNSRHFVRACSHLGSRLREDTYGLSCPRFLAAATPEAVPWGILGAKTTGRVVVVRVELGQSELDRFRMRHHRAYVGVENGGLRIMATQLVR